MRRIATRVATGPALPRSLGLAAVGGLLRPTPAMLVSTGSPRVGGCRFQREDLEVEGAKQILTGG